MQFKTIVAVLSLTSTVFAAPSLIKVRSSNSNGGGNGGSSSSAQCGSNQEAKCCEDFSQGGGLLGGLLVGISCVTLVGDVCSNNAQAACCQSGDQNGLVNIGNICSPISIL